MPRLLTLNHQVNLQFIDATFTGTKAPGNLNLLMPHLLALNHQVTLIYLCHGYWH